MASFSGTWARVVGEAAARRAVPVWTAVAMLAGVVFGGTGMAAHDLTGPATASWRFGAVLAASWVLLVIPAGRAMVEPRATAYLRALPVARWRRGVITAAIAVAVQAPWALLWGLGAGPSAAAVAAVVAALAMLAVAHAAEKVTWPHRAPRWRSGLGAMIGAHARVLRRGRGASLVRAAGIAALGGALAGLIARVNQLGSAEAVWWGLTVAAVALPMALGALVLPVLETDRRLDWLLRTSGCSWASRVLAAGLVLAALGAGLGATAAGTAALVGRAFDVTSLAAHVVLGAGLGAIGLRVGAWAVGNGDGGRVVIGMIAAALASLVVIGLIGAIGAAAIAAIGVSVAAAVASPRGGEVPP